jgi:hypothetical protein
VTVTGFEFATAGRVSMQGNPVTLSRGELKAVVLQAL